MSIAHVVIDAAKMNVYNTLSFITMTIRYFKKTRPFESMIYNMIMSIQQFINMRQESKMAKYRMNHLMYRLNQMEEVIEGNNPHNFLGGFNINRLQ